MAVASLSQAYPAEVVSLGTLGTRQCALATLVRQLQAQSPHLVFVSAAGPCGYWLARSRTNKGQVCWGVAPSVLPQKPGERVKPHRRDASTLARLMRSGALPPVSVPKIADAARRDLERARAAPLRALKTATCRLPALLLRHALRSTGQAHWRPAPLRGLSEGGGPLGRGHH
jgi:transposase